MIGLVPIHSLSVLTFTRSPILFYPVEIWAVANIAKQLNVQAMLLGCSCRYLGNMDPRIVQEECNVDASAQVLSYVSHYRHNVIAVATPLREV